MAATERRCGSYRWVVCQLQVEDVAELQVGGVQATGRRCGSYRWVVWQVQVHGVVGTGRWCGN